MPENKEARSSVVCSMGYRKAPEAIGWLCRVFGFERQAVYPGPNGTIGHAELTLGSGMIMLGSVKDNDPSRLIKQPDEIGGAETRGVNLIVPDADAVYARAKGAGAEIVLEITDQRQGGRGFTCRDLEGRIWNVGTYDPWQPK